MMAVVGLLFLPAFLATIGWQIYGMVNGPIGAKGHLLEAQRQELFGLRQELVQTRDRAETHLNALAQRMGRMQAQLLRLDALGSRLTQMAGLDARAFDFSSQPAVGGPEKGSNTNADAADVLENLDRLARALEDRSEHLTALESLLMDRQLSKAATPNGWPVEKGWMSSPFGIRADPFTGRRAFHRGVDIASPLGSPILAMADGVVSHAGLKQGYGLMVEVTHGHGYTTRYAHASEVLVKVGDRVTKGDKVARVGSSGRSTGPHLHFEVFREDKAANPVSYLRYPPRR